MRRIVDRLLEVSVATEEQSAATTTIRADGDSRLRRGSIDKSSKSKPMNPRLLLQRQLPLPPAIVERLERRLRVVRRRCDHRDFCTKMPFSQKRKRSSTMRSNRTVKDDYNGYDDCEGEEDVNLDIPLSYD